MLGLQKSANTFIFNLFFFPLKCLILSVRYGDGKLTWWRSRQHYYHCLVEEAVDVLKRRTPPGRSQSCKTALRLLGPDFLEHFSSVNWKQNENRRRERWKPLFSPSIIKTEVCPVGCEHSINSWECAVSCHWMGPSKKLREPHCACVPWATPRLCCGYLSTHDSFVCQSPAWSRVSTGSKMFVFLSGWA